MTQEITEHVLDAARRGDGDAFAVIWRALSPSVLGYLGARGVPDPEAVTSDVFVALLPRLAELRGGVAGLRTFVFSVAHARVVDEARKRARRPEHVELEPAAHDRPLPSAEHDAFRRLGDDRVRELLGSLTPDHREVLALRVVADLDLEQTATVMRRSVGSVKQLQRRALLALRAAVESRETPPTTSGVTPVGRPTITGAS